MPKLWTAMISRASTPRKRAAAKAFKAERAAWQAVKGTEPERDEDYKDWIRTLECMCCNILGERQKTSTEPAHTGMDRGMAQKAGDLSCIPLCHWHHLEDKWSHHKATGRRGEVFWSHWGIHRETLVATLNERFHKRQKIDD